MKNIKVVAFVPVKSTSTRIESKNVKLLDGKPLFIYTIENDSYYCVVVEMQRFNFHT